MRPKRQGNVQHRTKIDASNHFNSLNTDNHNINVREDMMIDALNASLVTAGENQLTLQNLKGNHVEAVLTEGFVPLGLSVHENIAYIISGKFDSDGEFLEGEIGSFPSPRWGTLLSGTSPDPELYLDLKPEYSPLYNFSNSVDDTVLIDDNVYIEPFRTAKLNFRSDRLIEVECQYSYDNSTNIIFTDDVEGNPVRLVNSRFKLDSTGTKAAIADRRGVKDTNTYSNKNFLSTNLIKVSDKILDLTFNGVTSGGKNKAGGYKYYFRYRNSDGAITDIVETSGLVVVAENNKGARSGEILNKTVSFTLNNLDRSFSFVEVLFSHSTSGEAPGVSNVYRIKNLFQIPTVGALKISLTGYEETEETSKENITISYSSIATAKTIAQFNDRLILGNVTGNVGDYEEFSILSQRLKIEEAHKDIQINQPNTGYADPINVYYNLGGWAGETYEVGIVYILKNGKGVTPAFPIRGLDNYNGTASYSSSYPINSNDGYKQGSNVGENKLGVYRTSKDRVMLKNNGTDTEVLYFKVNVSSIKTAAAKISDGFFFVKRERRKDALEQGYLVNTTTAPKSGHTVQDPASNGDQAWFSIGNPGSGLDALSSAYDNTQSIRDAAGKVSGTIHFPAPGRIWTMTVLDATVSPSIHFNNSNVRKGAEYNTVGIVSPNPPWSNKGHYAFYSGDSLCAPAEAASKFQGKFGHVLNDPNNTIIMREILAPNLTYTTSPQSQVWSRPDGFHGSRVFYALPAFKRVSIELREFYFSTVNNSPVTGFAVFKVIRVKNSGNKYYFITVNYTESSAGSGLLIGSEDTSPSARNMRYGGSYTGDHEAYTGFNFSEIEIFGNALKVTKLKLETRGPGTGGDYTVNYVALTANEKIVYPIYPIIVPPQHTLNTYSDRVIKVLRPDDFRMQPTTMDEKYSLDLNYIKSGNEITGDGSFGSRLRPIKSYQFLSGLQVGGLNTNDISQMALLASPAVDFEDYVGVVQGLKNNFLAFQLENDTVNTFNFPMHTANNYGYQGSDKSDYISRVQIDGIRFGVLINLYTSKSGPISHASINNNWKNIYNNSGVYGSYYQVGKRYSWDSLTSTIIDVFPGDCYISYTFKKVNKRLGVPGVIAASDPSIYKDDNADAGFSPSGFVFALVNECNHNPALRANGKNEGTLAVVSGFGETFYPHKSIDLLRSSLQSESKNYDFGYDYIRDKAHPILDLSSPYFNLDFSNRIHVSAPNVRGNFINGYQDFKGLNFRDYRTELGEITRLISLNDKLICVFANGIGLVPLDERTMVSESKGGVFLDDAKILAQRMPLISSEYGSTEQFSVIKTDSAVYGCDLDQSRIWQFAPNSESGFKVISDFNVQKILNIFKARLFSSPGILNYVITNYDRVRNNVIFSYYQLHKGKFSQSVFEIDPDVITPIDTGGDGNSGSTSDTVISEEKGLILTEGVIAAPYQLLDIPVSLQDRLPDDKPPVHNTYLELSDKKPATLYFNETLGVWVSRLSWNPIFMFNTRFGLYSLNTEKEREKIWKHFSDKVPYCHFYGDQHRFEFEFVVNKYDYLQKIIDNLVVVSNRVFPNRVILSIDELVDYDSLLSNDSSNVDLMRQRHETINWPFNVNIISGLAHIDFGITDTESERIVGGYFEFGGNIYIISNYTNIGGVNFSQILDQNGAPLTSLPLGITASRLEFGIFKQTMDYTEDHLYIEIGKLSGSNSKIRDKAIRVRMVYEGDKFVAINHIISKLTQSFS